MTSSNIRQSARRPAVKTSLDNPYRVNLPNLLPSEADAVAAEVLNLAQNDETRRDFIIGVNSVSKAVRTKEESRYVVIFREDSIVCEYLLECIAARNGQKHDVLTYCFVLDNKARLSIRDALGLASCTAVAWPPSLSKSTQLAQNSAHVPRSPFYKDKYLSVKIKSAITSVPMDMKAHKLAKRDHRSNAKVNAARSSATKRKHERRRLDKLHKTRRSRKVARRERQKATSALNL